MEVAKEWYRPKSIHDAINTAAQSYPNRSKQGTCAK